MLPSPPLSRSGQPRSAARRASSRGEALALALAACAGTACGGASDQAPVAAAPQPVAQAVAPEPEPTEPAAPAPPAPAYQPKAGFSEVKVEDGVPLCVFPDVQAWYEAKHLRDVGKQKLRAKSSVVIGAFGPWCVHESCDQRPSLQCQVERQGDTLVVRSRYWGEHKDGATCTQDCKSVTASCTTPELEAGTYTVKHGEATFTLEIPGVLREPCFGTERPPPAPEAPPTPPG